MDYVDKVEIVDEDLYVRFCKYRLSFHFCMVDDQ